MNERSLGLLLVLGPRRGLVIKLSMYICGAECGLGGDMLVAPRLESVFCGEKGEEMR